MPKPLIIHTLTEKRAEILGQIKAYEAQIAHAKHDLAHVNATIELFAAPDHLVPPAPPPQPKQIHRLKHCLQFR